jgi:galactoside O-acetyltransferase
MFLNKEQLSQVGFKSYGVNVLISDKCSIYGAQDIIIGNNVRIDDFCILSGKITIGNYVHIACHTTLIGKGGIYIDDYAGISGHCSIYSSSDDYSGNFLTNPMIEENYTNIRHGQVLLMKHALIGAGSVVLPGVCIGVGAAIGALSLVKNSIGEYEIWGGNPLRFIRSRSQNLLLMEKQHRDGNRSI